MSRLFALRSFALVSLMLGAVVSMGPGCAKPATPDTTLQSTDLSVGMGLKFDPNEIVDSASFTDTQGLTPDQVQDFLRQTPYKRSSFLETYQSNGVRAVDAIVNASTTYRLNPLVFLVRLEVAQGLIGEQFYPFPPSRVEYAFLCGCENGSTCDAALAGLDKQIDCVGRAMRASLDEIKANQQTSGGWGPSKQSTTVDGQHVTPTDDSTAALYQYDPVVGTGSSGNWLYWNIWQNYATALDYAPPVADTTSGATWIGSPCTADALCDYSGGKCLSDDHTPGGDCSFDCSNTDCPADTSRAQTFCATFDSNTGGCLVVCNPNAPACRPNYTCVEAQKFGDPNTTQYVCYN